jgi:hypothetical protein
MRVFLIRRYRPPMRSLILSEAEARGVTMPGDDEPGALSTFQIVSSGGAGCAIAARYTGDASAATSYVPGADVVTLNLTVNGSKSNAEPGPVERCCVIRKAGLPSATTLATTNSDAPSGQGVADILAKGDSPFAGAQLFFSGMAVALLLSHHMGHANALLAQSLHREDVKGISGGRGCDNRLSRARLEQVGGN